MSQGKTLLRFVTTGSVDDGKSTLIGRLLYETQSIFEDQYEAIRNTSLKRGLRAVDLSLLLDGLAAEREQFITIDVAHRYFSSARRKFIIADCPGHEQYTRNMVTGASTAQLAVLLVDARNGVVTQSRRHAFLVSLLQIPHLIVAINKMDLVEYAEEAYDRIVSEFSAFFEKLSIHDLAFIPVSALHGDNVTTPSRHMPWYHGPSLLECLEQAHTVADRNLIDFRFPVQYVVRPDHSFRGFAGRIASGTIAPGEEVLALPSGRTSTVKSVVTFGGELPQASASQSVVLTLADEIDISRGDMIVRRNNLPHVGNHFDATLCWMDTQPMSSETRYLLKHTTQHVRATIVKIHHRINVDTLHRERVDTFSMNEIGRVEIETSRPIFFDPYTQNRGTGSFMLIDPVSNRTAAAGTIRGPARELDEIVRAASAAGAISPRQSPHVTRWPQSIAREQREERNGHKAAVLWFTGYSASGKTTIAHILDRRLFSGNVQGVLLDGDNMRHGLCGDLGFSERDRTENIRRVSEVAKLFFENGMIVLCAFISPFRNDRAFARGLVPGGRFLEIYVKCDLEVCKRRDPRGLYKKALAGEIGAFTGISSPYEAPEHPELVVDTETQSAEEISGRIEAELRARGILG